MIYARFAPRGSRRHGGRLIIDQDGQRQSFKIERAIIRSHARLTYDQVQAVYDGRLTRLIARCRMAHCTV